MPAYLSPHLQTRNYVQSPRSSLSSLFAKTDFAKRRFRYSAPAVWIFQFSKANL